MAKARYGLSDVGFDTFLSIIGDMLPKENKLPANTYHAKKLISPLTMGVEKIHACRNHCILYRGDEYKDLDKCPKCGASRYKTNKDYRHEDCAASKSDGYDGLSRNLNAKVSVDNFIDKGIQLGHEHEKTYSLILS